MTFESLNKLYEVSKFSFRMLINMNKKQNSKVN